MDHTNDMQGSITVLLLFMVVDFCKTNHLKVPKQCTLYFNDDLSEIHDVYERVPLHTWYNILHDIHDQYPMNGLGLSIANHVKSSYAGILSYLTFSQSNLFEALPDFIHYERLLYDFNIVHFQIKDGFVELSWSDYHGKAGQLVDETFFAVLINIVKQVICPQKITLKCIKFFYPEPTESYLYEKYFGCPVIFNAPTNSIIMSTNDLKNITLPNPDKVLYRILKKKANRLLAQLTPLDEFEQILHSSMVHCIQNKTTHIEDIANHMGMSTTLLRKKLREQDISFNAKLNQVRQKLAEQYLKDNTFNVNEIADLLGYAEQSVFQRAFKSWTGETPLKFRKNRT